jgi:regulatory protein RepA
MTVASSLPVPRTPLRLDVRKALTTEPPSPDFVLPGLSTGTVGALVAPGATGKTLLLLQVSAALAGGLPVLGGRFFSDARALQADPAKVVLVVAEETASLMHLRLHAAVDALLTKSRRDLFDPSHERLMTLLQENLHIYPLAGQFRMLLDGGDPQCDGLAVLNDISDGARLVAVDPLRQFHTGDENDSWVMTKLMQDLQRLACTRDLAVIVAHHTNKWSTANGQGDKAGASRGSAAFTDAVRWQMNLSMLDADLAKSSGIDVEDVRQYVRLDLAKTNYLPPQSPLVLKRGTGGAFLPITAPGRAAAKRSPFARGRV